MARVSSDYNLAVIHPTLAGQWHPAKNGHLTPHSVTPSSGKRISWLCQKGHEWQDTVSNRAHFQTGCPYCSGQRVCADNCLEHVAPHIAKQWHPTKNKGLTPSDVTSGSNKRIWWVCPEGHEWQALVSARTRGSGCPGCSGHQATKDNNLQKKNPRLAAQWHPTKNGGLQPKDVTPRSAKKVIWLCDKGHEWQASVSNRTGRATRAECPYCSGKRFLRDDSLETFAPEIARQWHPLKNGKLTPKDVTPGSGMRVWWLCGKGHEWQAVVNNRRRGNGCPYCAGHRATKDNNLRVKNPGLAQQWHPTKNGSLRPKDVRPKSTKKVWWLCSRGHEWIARVAHRSNGSGCPYCSGRKVCDDNCLATLSPNVAKEWHPSKNGDMTPRNVVNGSNKKVWWLCRKGHEWQAKIVDRTVKGHGCLGCYREKGRRQNLQIVNPKPAKEWHPTRQRSTSKRV
jgi:hypothetical protein